jgi:hypothetical protein
MCGPSSMEIQSEIGLVDHFVQIDMGQSFCDGTIGFSRAYAI